MDKITLGEFKKKNSINESYNYPNNYGEEGKDHINACVQSKLKIGRMLDPGYCLSFSYPHLGRFKSVLTLTYWLKSGGKDDRIRTLKGPALKRYVAANNLKGKFIPNHNAIVLKATYIRLTSNPKTVESIKVLPELEILSYLTDKNTGVRITTGYAKHMTRISKEVISAIKEGREPDYSAFVDSPSKSGSGFSEGTLIKKNTTAPDQGK